MRKHELLPVVLFLICLLLPNFSPTIFGDTKGSVSAQLTIVSSYSVTLDDVSVIEGETAVFTVSLPGEADEEITVDYETVEATATPGVDYVPDSGTITFEPGEISVTISVQTLEDPTLEEDETFYLDLSNPQGPAKIADGRGVGTIADNDSNPASIIISNDTQYEGNPAEFVVSLSNSVKETVTVQYYTMDDTAVRGEDYEGVPESSPLTLTFQPGETEKTITIDTLEDITDEPDETFQVVLENPTGPAVILDGRGLGTILDDDPPTPEEEEAGGAGGEETKQAGGAGEAEEVVGACTPMCPPVISTVRAKKSDHLVEDKNGNDLVDPGDVLRYKITIRRIAFGGLQKAVYTETLPPQLSFVQGSLVSDRGESEISGAAGMDSISVRFSTNEANDEFQFPINIEYKARLKSSVSDELGYVASQGVVTFSNSPTVVTDDPDTLLLDDPTRTPVGENTSKVERDENDQLPISLEKRVLEIKRGEDYPPEFNSAGELINYPSQDENKSLPRLVEPGDLVKFSVKVTNSSEKNLRDLIQVNSIDNRLKIQDGSIAVKGNALGTEITRLPERLILTKQTLKGKDQISLSYWVRVSSQISNQVGHLGVPAFVVGNDLSPVFSDDPDTKLSNDRTVLLLSSECSTENYMEKWNQWLNIIKNSEIGLTPVIFSKSEYTAKEKDKNIVGTHSGRPNRKIGWALVGGQGQQSLPVGSSGKLAGSSNTPGERWPDYVLSGAGKFDFEPGKSDVLIGTDYAVGFRGTEKAGAGGSTSSTEATQLAVQQFVNAPVFAVPSSDEGIPILSIEQENVRLCGKGYLPFVTQRSPDFAKNRDLVGDIIELVRAKVVVD